MHKLNISKDSIGHEVNEIYNYFYYTSYKDFFPDINMKAKDNIRNFQELIKDFDFKKIDYSSLSIKYIDAFYDRAKNLFDTIYLITYGKITEEIAKFSDKSKEEIHCLEGIIGISYISLYISFVLDFQGEGSVNLDKFRGNYLLYMHLFKRIIK